MQDRGRRLRMPASIPGYEDIIMREQYRAARLNRLAGLLGQITQNFSADFYFWLGRTPFSWEKGYAHCYWRMARAQCMPWVRMV